MVAWLGAGGADGALHPLTDTKAKRTHVRMRSHLGHVHHTPVILAAGSQVLEAIINNSCRGVLRILGREEQGVCATKR